MAGNKKCNLTIHYISDNVGVKESNSIYHQLTTAVGSLSDNNNFEYSANYSTTTEAIINTITDSSSHCEMKLLLRNWDLEHLYINFRVSLVRLRK